MRHINTFRQLFSARSRSSAGDNCGIFRMALNALPMYFLPNGWSFPPLSLLLVVNSRCNLACRICDIGQKNRDSIFYQNLVGDSPHDMSLDDYRAIVSQLDKKVFISITSTEPLLWQPLLEAVRWTALSGRQMNLTTNGFLLEEMAMPLVRDGLNKLTVSLDGPAETHDHIRGVKGSYARAIAGIKKVAACRKDLSAQGLRVIVNCVLSPLNQGRITEFLGSLPLEIVDQINIELMTFCTKETARLHNRRFGADYPASETCLSGGVDPGGIDAALTLRDLREAARRFKSKIALRFPLAENILHDYFHLPEKHLSRARCVFPYFTAQLNSRGELIGLTRCYPTSYGNALTDGFRNAWNSKKMRSFRRLIRGKEALPGCARCEGVLYDL